MPSYNSEKYIEFALTSVAQQKYTDFELIIYDGASTDKTLDVIRSYENKINIRLISEKDGGVNDACRKGFAAANGDFICHLCSTDGYFDPNFLFEATSFLENNIEYDAIFSSGAQEISDTGKPLYKWRPWVQPFFSMLPYRWHKIIAVQHAVPFPDMGWLVKREVFLKYFPEITDKFNYGKINPFLGFVKVLYASKAKFAVLNQTSTFGRHHPGQWGARIAEESKASIKDFRKLKYRQIFKFDLGLYTPLIRLYSILMLLFCFIAFGGFGYYYQKILEFYKSE